MNMNVPTEPMNLESYVEDCRMKLFDHAFLSYFKGTDAFTKTNNFKEYKGSDLVVRRVLFRYVFCFCPRLVSTLAAASEAAMKHLA